MKTFTLGTIQRLFALLLCAALLLPLVPAPIRVSAAEAVSGMANAKTVVDQVRSLYSGGTKSNSLEMDCGNDLSGGGEKSYMTIVTGTTATHFSNFQKSLKNAGYIAKNEWTLTSNSSAANSFGDYTSPDGTCRVYTYFFPGYKETRIIVDTQADTVEGYIYEPQPGKLVEPKMVMWGVSVNSPEGPQLGEWRNCGGIIVIRMPDNSLFIHDGGDNEQWSEEACDEFLAFCRDLTGTTAGEKMVINTWFLSHAHKDHHRGFTRFINHHYDKFDLKNVMYNIDKERTGVNFDLTDLMNLLSRVYPEARYYKPHTGDSINIAGVKLDVIYALEDRFIPNSSNKLIIDTDNQGGTYRDGLYKDESTKTYDFNDTSTVIRITFENDVNAILYADSTRAKSIYKTVYPVSFFKTDIMLVPHHGHNDNSDLVEYADAKVYLQIQHKKAIYGPDYDVTTVDMYGTYRETPKVRFTTMFPDMNVAAGKEKVDYQVFWSGSEVVTLDINTLGKVLNGTSTQQYYTTQPAMIFDYTGWGVMDLNDTPYTDALISKSESVVEDPVTMTTPTIRYNPVGTGALQENGRYVIKHKQMQTVMSYDAVAKTAGTPNKANSLWPSTANPVDPTATNIYYETEGKGIYLDHSNRALAMWILHQEDTATDAKLSTGPLAAMFGGKAYGEVWLNKGNATEWDSSGNKTAGRNGVYWNGVYGKDSASPATQYRYLDPRYDDAQWVTTSEPTGTDSSNPKKRYIIEDLGNGDFVIYWRSVSGATMGFLTCDEWGNWGIKKFTDSTSDTYPSVPEKGSAELKALMLNIYQYTSFTDSKTIQFTGSKTYNVCQGATQADVVSVIQDSILLNDTTRHGLRVPCNGTSSKIGYGYLKFNKTFDSSKAGTYTVQVLFRNDDNTDTEITTLTVNVMDDPCTINGHSYEAIITAPTCTKDGYTTYTCTVCGDGYVADGIPALGHSYKTVTVDPACGKEGNVTKNCSVCGDTQVEVLPSTGHRYEAVVVAPDCTNQGYTVYTCECGDQYTADVTEALGHNYAVVVTTPTCTEAGYTTYFCSCGYSYQTNPMEALGHSYNRTVVAPSCTKNGYAVYTCACGDSYTADEVAVLDHNYVNGSCVACGAKDPDYLPTYYLVGYINGADYGCEADYQNMGEYKFTDGKLVATFTQDSYVFLKSEGNTDWYMTWSYCTGTSATFYSTQGGAYEKMFVPGNVIITFTLVDNGDNSLVLSYTVGGCAHDYNVVRAEPTCTVSGSVVSTCRYCNDVIVEELPATGHRYETVTVSATCTTDGSVKDTCATCGDTKLLVVPATGHSYADGVCGACGAIDPNYSPAVVVPTLVLKAPALEFKDMITVNAVFTAENIQDVVEMGMITYTTNVTSWSVETAAYVIPGTTYDETTARYIASSQGIHAKYLGDTVYLAVYAKLSDGTYTYSKLASYSPIQYATNQLANSTDTALKQLLVAMLNYGAEAQKYFSHNTSNLANASLTTDQLALPAAYDASMIKAVATPTTMKQGVFVNNSGFASRKPAISFEGAFCINYFFTPNYAPEDGITLYYWNYSAYNRAGVLTVTNATGSIKLEGSGTGEYRGDITGVAAKQLSEAVYVAAVYENGGSTWTSGVLGYSIGAYCSSQASKGGAIADLAKATAVYGYHAKQYFG